MFSTTTSTLNSAVPVSRKIKIASSLSEALSAISSSAAVTRNQSFLDPLARFVYPCLVLGLFERDAELRGLMISILEAINSRGLLRQWVSFVDAATAFACGETPRDKAGALQALVSAGGALLADGPSSSGSEMTREAKIVAFFYVNLIKFEKDSPALVAPVVRALGDAFARGQIAPDCGLHAPLLLTLSSAISANKGEARAAVGAAAEACPAAFACLEAMLKDQARRAVMTSLANGALPTAKAGREESELALVVLSAINTVDAAPFRTQALRVLAQLLRMYDLGDLASNILSSLLIVHEAAKWVVSVDADVTIEQHLEVEELYIACNECMERLLAVPTVAAWRGVFYKDLLAWTTYGVVNFRGRVRSGVLAGLARLFSAGKIGLASDFCASFLGGLANFLGAKDGSFSGLDARLGANIPKGWSLAKSTAERQAAGQGGGAVAGAGAGAGAGEISSSLSIAQVRLEDAAVTFTEVLVLFSIESTERKLVEKVLGIFGVQVWDRAERESPLLGDLFSCAVLRTISRLLEVHEERDNSYRSVQAANVTKSDSIIELQRTIAVISAEATATREKLKDTERELEELKNALCCPICLDSFMNKDPCVLVCGHCFCSGCLVGLTNNCCPQCRAPIREPPRKMRGLG